MENEREREIEENELCASKVHRIFERRRIFLSFHPRCFRPFPIKANCSCNASNPATSSNMGLYESNARRVYMCGCVCVGREEGIFTDSSIYIGFSTHLRVVYNVLCSIKTRTQQRACNKKEGEERTIEREGKGNYIERNENREIKKKEKRKERRSETERYRLLGKGIEEKIPLEGKYIRDKRERKMLVC